MIYGSGYLVIFLKFHLYKRLELYLSATLCYSSVIEKALNKIWSFPIFVYCLISSKDSSFAIYMGHSIWVIE